MFNRKSLIAFVLVAFVAAGNLSAAPKKGTVNLGYNGSERTQTPLTLNPAVKTGVLSNGMTYFVLQNSEPKNRISLRLAVKAGSCMEEDDQQGVAHLVEHMAFNGTEHFEKKEIISFSESIGMQWGPELNAYTSYEQTVYMLEIPADSKEILEKAMLIMHDWACAITLDPQEIDMERGVVKEEWRLRQGANQRLWDELKAVSMKDSRFLERDPIGQMNIIDTVPAQRVIDFYKKWYRPELMSISVIGDMPAAELEKAMRKAMEVIPASEEKITSPVYTIPLPSEKTVKILRDKEWKNTIIEIDSRVKEPAPVTTYEQVYENIALDMAAYIAGQRLSEIAKQSDSPFLGAGVSYGSLSNLDSYKCIWINPKDEKTAESLSRVLEEFNRFIIHGATESELKRIKSGYKADVQQRKTKVLGIENPQYASDLVSYFISGNTAVAYADYYDKQLKLIDQITLEDIAYVCQKYFGNMGELLYVAANDSVKLPSEAELMKIWTESDNMEVTAYEEAELPDMIMERPAATAKVVSKKKLKNVGATEYVLENGARLIFKKTDFEKDVICMNVSSAGGFPFVAEDEIPSAAICDNYVWYSGLNGYNVTQVYKILADKVWSAEWGMHRWGEYFTANGSNQDFEVALQVLYQFFVNPQFTDEGWNYLYQNLATQAKNHGVTINDAINDETKKFFYDNSPYINIVDKDFIAALDKDKAEKVFRERFSNIADFKFVFIGDFNEKKLLDLCRAYIGSIPGDKEKIEECKFVYFSEPKGIKTDVVRKGSEPQSYVQMMFRGALPAAENVDAGFTDEEMMNQLASLLETRLMEVIREDLGGTYGVGVSGSCDGYPERQYTFSVSFGCAPDRVLELRDKVIETIKEVQATGLDQSYSDKLAEIYRRNVEIAMRDNGWWINRIRGIYYDTDEPETVISDIQKKIPAMITPERMKELANLYFDTENYFFGYLVPEK